MDGIVSLVAVEVIVAVIAVEVIASCIAVDDVVAATAMDGVTAGVAMDKIRQGGSHYGVVIRAAAESQLHELGDPEAAEIDVVTAGPAVNEQLVAMAEITVGDEDVNPVAADAQIAQVAGVRVGVFRLAADTVIVVAADYLDGIIPVSPYLAFDRNQAGPANCRNFTKVNGDLDDVRRRQVAQRNSIGAVAQGDKKIFHQAGADGTKLNGASQAGDPDPAAVFLYLHGIISNGALDFQGVVARPAVHNRRLSLGKLP